LAKVLLSGEIETIVLILSSGIAGAITYFWRNVSFFLEETFDGWKRGYRYRKARRLLVKQQNAEGLSRNRKRELASDIEELDRIFTSSVKTRFRNQMKDKD
jgi:hypothetical protein